MSTLHYFYVEAVNLGGVIDDTEDLSTRRAGGYMLLQLTREIAALKNELEVVSEGASQGLFALKRGVTFATARASIQGVLSQPLYAQATVLCTGTDEIPASDYGQLDFQGVREYLLALNRRKQLTSLGICTAFARRDHDGLTPSDKGLVCTPSPKAAQVVCQIDYVRPAAVTLWHKDDTTISASRSTALRRIHGRELRQKFYATELGTKANKDYTFTDDFEQLTSFCAEWQERPPARLEHKMAVFYADGNSFSALARQCDGQTLPQFDRAVQSQRRQFLVALVDLLNRHKWGKAFPNNAQPTSTLPTPANGRLRVETLMWGGDEFLLVLPAWLALEAVQLFYSQCQIRWNDQVLTHAVGLVFAHHNAPISPLQKLAKNLADKGKQGHHKNSNSLNWVVLESFDHTGQDLSQYWTVRGFQSLGWADVTLNPDRLNLLMQHQPLLAALPRSAVYAIVRLLNVPAGLEGEAPRLLKRAYSNVHERARQSQRLDEWERVWQALMGASVEQREATASWGDRLPEPQPDHLRAWLILLELWDYLPAPGTADTDGRAA